MSSKRVPPRTARSLYVPKAPTGIKGLDHITNGGVPKGRTSLVCGGAGCGKTLLAMEFLVCGAKACKEPGVYLTFEETEEELIKNFTSLHHDLPDLVKKKKIAIEYIHIERSEIEETGEYDLQGLFARIEAAVKSVGAKRLVLDTIEALFAGLEDEMILRSEIRRLFRWMKERGLTAIVTGERGEGSFTRHGLEEYVSDCVILLDNRVHQEISTRRLRVVKYRGTLHGTNEYPFLIDDTGVSVMPVSALTLDHKALKERVSTGIPKLDGMFGGKGYFRGTSILISGTAGTGKTSIAAHFAQSTCERGEKALHFCFEESEDQLFRNMESIGIDLAKWKRKGLLKVIATRPSFYGLEMHLVHMHKAIEEFNPSVVVIDPISNMVSVGSFVEVRMMLTRLIDSLKAKGITAMFTSLTSGNMVIESSEVGISSLIDTWISVREIEAVGERNRGLYILKSRGMRHSNQVREFVLTDKGVDLIEVYVGPGGVLTGSARKAQEAFERAQNEVATTRRGLPFMGAQNMEGAGDAKN